LRNDSAEDSNIEGLINYMKLKPNKDLFIVLPVMFGAMYMTYNYAYGWLSLIVFMLTPLGLMLHRIMKKSREARKEDSDRAP
jgi:F0F1-type ATP synthase assembly protein I